ncbi:MAG: MBOAT family protein [Lachnospiraceae bacterium]|nr:MBOAT family protein [Lachnospiraceae bacterium]
MAFSDLHFIWIFLPLFFLLYYNGDDRKRDSRLMYLSILFYAIGTWGHPEWLVVLLLCIIIDFYSGRVIESCEKRGFPLAVCVIFHVILLAYFKYLSPSGMPLAISFYTFQGLSYLIDVKRRTIPAEKSLLKFGTYMLMFEQLTMGPILRYDLYSYDFDNRQVNEKKILDGVTTFAIGLGLKVLIANPIGKLWAAVGSIGYEDVSTPLAWMGIFAYSFQLYFDFYGYSLMAIGIGRMLGFRIPDNFDHPYMSVTMTEFWRKWHITLGTWFRDYVYIPLGGSRKGAFRTIFNLLIVWILTGIWHGGHMNFVIWGLVIFVLIVIEKLFIGKFYNRFKFFGHIYMLLAIPLTWAIFAEEKMDRLAVLFTRLFPFFGQGPWSSFREDYIKYLKQYGVFFIVCFLFSTWLPANLWKTIKIKLPGLALVISMILIGICTYLIYRGSNDSFMYLRF